MKVYYISSVAVPIPTEDDLPNNQVLPPPSETGLFEEIPAQRDLLKDLFENPNENIKVYRDKFEAIELAENALDELNVDHYGVNVVEIEVDEEPFKLGNDNAESVKKKNVIYANSATFIWSDEDREHQFDEYDFRAKRKEYEEAFNSGSSLGRKFLNLADHYCRGWFGTGMFREHKAEVQSEVLPAIDQVLKDKSKDLNSLQGATLSEIFRKQLAKRTNQFEHYSQFCKVGYDMARKVEATEIQMREAKSNKR